MAPPQNCSSKPTSSFHVTAYSLFSIWPRTLTKEVNFSTLDHLQRWELCDEILPHVRRLMQDYQHLTVDDQCACATPQLAGLLVATAWYKTECALRHDR